MATLILPPVPPFLSIFSNNLVSIDTNGTTQVPVAVGRSGKKLLL